MTLVSSRSYILGRVISQSKIIIEFRTSGSFDCFRSRRERFHFHFDIDIRKSARPAGRRYALSSQYYSDRAPRSDMITMIEYYH